MSSTHTQPSGFLAKDWSYILLFLTVDLLLAADICLMWFYWQRRSLHDRVASICLMIYWNWFMWFSCCSSLKLGKFCVLLNTVSFLATVCKTVHPMLLDRCLSVCPVCLWHWCIVAKWLDGSRVKTKLGTQVGLGPGHIVLDEEDPAPPPQRGTAPNFQPMPILAKRLDGSRWHLVER